MLLHFSMTTMSLTATDADHRVLVFAPIGRDGPAVAEFVRRAGLAAIVCESLGNLQSRIEEGAALVVLAEEGLFGKDIASLAKLVADQPAWSDLPFIVLTSKQEQVTVGAWRTKLVAQLRNVSLLERPLQTLTLTSAVLAAARARERQYEVRSLLKALETAAAKLDAQVQERTSELAEANQALRVQMEERAQMEEILRQTQKIEAIGQLTGGIAHDFNNLLMVITGGLEMLDRQSDSARRRRLMQGMHQAAQRGAALTRQLLAFSRRAPLKPETIALGLQIGGMRELLDRSLRGDVHVTVNLPEDLWPVAVDPGELELVILNLAVNARDAMPNGGMIEIRADNAPAYKSGDLEGEFVRLSIIDQGTGMSDEVRSRVFEPFYTTKDVGKGSGLGLAQVHGFATQSGGAIEIESEIGRGTRVSLFLPRSLEAPATQERHLVNLHAEVAPAQQRGAVLLVEDDDEVAALVKEMLEQLGYGVTRVASAMAALGALSNGRDVDLVFSDVMMPGGMNGVDLVREIRRRRTNIPVLLTSAYAEAAKDRAEAEGVNVLPKPYRIEELAAAVRTAMRPAAH
jgi:signal transduction histidine kinase/CheY-like chemotaxis protein